jgi:hypothetical protein
MELTFKISLENANLIMKHLGNAPFVEVADLIANLKAQAAPQLAPQEAPPT